MTDIIEWLESAEGRSWSRMKFRHIHTSTQIHRRPNAFDNTIDEYAVVFASLEPPEEDRNWHGAYYCNWNEPPECRHGDAAILHTAEREGARTP